MCVCVCVCVSVSECECMSVCEGVCGIRLWVMRVLSSRDKVDQPNETTITCHTHHIHTYREVSWIHAPECHYCEQSR